MFLKLTDEQIRKFATIIKEPDANQSHLELFGPTIIKQLFTILRKGDSNVQKAELIETYLKDLGFYTVGLGTNVLTMANPHYTGVVYKIALDEAGLADNFNDVVLSKAIQGSIRLAQVYDKHPSGIVTVQERAVLLTPNQVEVATNDILDTLTKLSNKYLIADLSVDKSFQNYGLTSKGELIIIDGSDLYPKSMMSKNSFICRMCHKDIYRYTPTFSHVFCPKCGHTAVPMLLRPNKEKEVKTVKKMRAMLDGSTPDIRAQIRAKEIEAIQRRLAPAPRPENQVIVEKNLIIDEEEEPMSTENVPVQVEVSPRTDTARVADPSEEDDEVIDNLDVNGDDFEEEEDLGDGIGPYDKYFDQVPQDKLTAQIKELEQASQGDLFASDDFEDDLDDEDEDDDDEDDDEEEDSNLDMKYSIIEVTDENEGDGAGIFIDVNLDKYSFDEVYDEFGLPIYVSLGDETYNLAISAETMRKLLIPTIQELLEERELMNRIDKAEEQVIERLNPSSGPAMVRARVPVPEKNEPEYTRIPREQIPNLNIRRDGPKMER